MIWALLAAYLTRKPPLVQAIVLGLCTGLFVGAAASANDRDPVLGRVVVQVLVVAIVFGAAFHAGLTLQRRHGWNPDQPAPAWLYLAYTLVWLLALMATIASLLGAGGFKVAVLAIVPLVLIAPTAFLGIRLVLRRSPA
jgi:hypothetical protein